MAATMIVWLVTHACHSHSRSMMDHDGALNELTFAGDSISFKLEAIAAVTPVRVQEAIAKMRTHIVLRTKTLACDWL